MSKKDYIAFAKMFQEFDALVSCVGYSKATFNSLVSEAAKCFKEDNPNFNRTRFLSACEPD